MCNSEPAFAPLFVFFLSKGKPVGKHGAARVNVTFGRAALPLTEIY